MQGFAHSRNKETCLNNLFYSIYYISFSLSNVFAGLLLSSVLTPVCPLCAAAVLWCQKLHQLVQHYLVHQPQQHSASVLL